MPARHPDAPRLIEWTGERCVPWTPVVAVVYEHYHRYLWAQPLVAGRRVLDLGSGEGFGAALLADAAREVVGVDLDDRAVEHSRLNYAGPTLDFRAASATDLSGFADGEFDAVVAFEVIEHISDQQRVLSEAARVLGPGGLLIVSTPDRRAYADELDEENPYHERELTQEEFTELLGRRFSTIALFAQRGVAGSRIEALGPVGGERHLDVQIERDGDDWRPGEPLAPLYVIAVASNSELPDFPVASTLSDFGVEAVRGPERERDRLSEERNDLAHQVHVLRLGLDEERRRTAALSHELAKVESSVSWNLLKGARERFYGLVGRDSVAGRTVSGALRRIGRRL